MREKIEAELAKLKASREHAQAAVESARANLAAHNGAIEVLERLIAEERRANADEREG
jgi:hypothetical protein